MREQHPEGGDGLWLSPEEEAILDRVAAELAAKRAKLPPEVRAAQRERTRRRCAEAKRHRLRQEAHDSDQGELPAGNGTIPGEQP